MSQFFISRVERFRPTIAKIAVRVLIGCIVSLFAVSVRADPLLSAVGVAGIFSSRTNEGGMPFLPIAVTIVEGAFTAPGRTEAVVSFSDANQPHALGIAEIWLLRFEKERWEPVVKVAESDTAEFVTVDLNEDGALELLTHTTAGNQGYFVILRRLIYFKEGAPADLLTFEGFDNTGWPEKGICAFDARFTFKDLNKDAVLDVELTEYYDYCQKDGDKSVFLRRSEKKTLFRPILSTSGSIVGIERLH